MEDYRRDFQDLYRHPDVVVPAGAAYRAGAEWILNDIEGQIRGGTTFNAGETIQMGWMTLLISAKQSGELEILEPKFGSMPVQWVRGANNTIRDFTIQREVCDQVRVDTAYPSMRQSAVTSPNFMKDNQEFELSRDASKGNDSGWVFREGGYRGSNGTLSSLYQIAIAVPAVIPFLALPPGSVVKRSAVGLKISVGRSEISDKESDFLGRLLGSVYFHG